MSEKENIQNEENKLEKKLNTSNIFDDFDVDEELEEDIKKEKKDFWYYIQKIGTSFKYINLFLLLVVLLLVIYIFIEQSDEVGGFADNKDYLDPICTILIGNDKILNGNYLGNGENHCSSITLTNEKIKKNYKNKEKEYFIETAKLLKNAYIYNNVKNSPEVLFAIEKSNNKTNVKKIISDFDILKNKFSSPVASRISCSKFKVDGNILETSCYFYSKHWEDNIPGENIDDSLKTLKGNSITFAASFLNFLEKDNTFSLIDKQRDFKLENYINDGYDFRTLVNLRLRYNKAENNNL